MSNKTLFDEAVRLLFVRFFYRKRLELRVLPWQQHSWCHSASFVMHISGAKFKECHSNISGDILD